MRRQAYPAEDPANVPPPESLTTPYLALLGPASRGVTGQAFEAQLSGAPSATSGPSSARSSS